MPAINAITRQKIKAYLEAFIESKVQNYRDFKAPVFETTTSYLQEQSSAGRLKPFHAAIIPQAVMRLNAFERGFSTSLGTTFEECACLIAQDHHQYAERGYDLKGPMSRAALNEIERQVALYDRNPQESAGLPTLPQMTERVLQAQRADDLEIHTSRADLYILTHDGRELFFEIKSPKPNKGQCLEVTQRLLRFHLLRGQNRPQVQAYFAMAYNPYGAERSHYRWAIPRQYMPFDSSVLIAQEFWTLIGGPGTYNELLELYRIVGKEKSKYILDAFVYGFG